MLRIITWEEHFEPSDKILDKMGWRTLTREPSAEHPASFLAKAQRWIKILAKYPDQLIIIQTIDHLYFDALRVALKENWIANEVFCYGPDDDGKMECTITHIDQDGRMDYWPDVFHIWRGFMRRLL